MCSETLYRHLAELFINLNWILKNSFDGILNNVWWGLLLYDIWELFYSFRKNFSDNIPIKIGSKSTVGWFEERRDGPQINFAVILIIAIKWVYSEFNEFRRVQGRKHI